MTQDTQEHRLLDKYRKRLQRAEAELTRLRDLQQEVRGLRQVVAGLEAMVGETTTQPSRDTAPRARATATRERPYAGARKPNLAEFLRTLYADGKQRTVSDVMEVLRITPEFRDHMPSRNSVGNRHGDLRDQGYLTQVARGTYELAREGTENPDERGGPHPAGQLVVEKPPAEDVIDPRPGHPYNMEGAAGEGYRTGV